LAISKRGKITERQQMADGKFYWGLIDHALVGLKLTNLAEEMHESIRAEIGQIQFDNLGNSNSQAIPTLIIAMHLRRTDECIEETYRAYCEVWEKQGGKKTADFIRAVSANAIPVIISARTNAVIAELSGQCARTGSPTGPHNARMESFKSSMSRLAARWVRKLEIEARECEHSESASRSNQHDGFDRRENLRKAIIGRRAGIERINRTLDKLPLPGSLSQFGQPVRPSQRSIQHLIQRRLEHEAALAELEAEEARLAMKGGQVSEERRRDPEQSSEHALAPMQTQQTSTLPTAHVRRVAPGVAQVSLADLNVPVGTSLKKTKSALLKLGAPARKLKDPRILEAADYKIKNPKSTYKEVSIKFFRIPGRADSIRSWVNKRKSPDGRE
jgi:hypothetical protein